MLTQTNQPAPQDNRIVSRIDRMPEPTAFKIETAKKSKEGLDLEVHVLSFIGNHNVEFISAAEVKEDSRRLDAALAGVQWHTQEAA